MNRTHAYFLWVGSTLPDVARVSILSAAEAGFETVVFSDRQQAIAHPRLRVCDWQEIGLPWTPDQVRLQGEAKPCYAAFSDLFRFALLSRHDGWWFDCDTIVLRPVAEFSALLRPDHLVLGRESQHVVNGAVIGSSAPAEVRRLFDRALPAFPVLKRWGVVGPALLSKMVRSGKIKAQIQDRCRFYPLHHTEIPRIYVPDECEALLREEKDWYCLNLWGEVLSRSGLRYLSPPRGSYLADLLTRRPELGSITGDVAGMAAYLARNLRRLDDLDSGSIALRTLGRKIGARLRIGAA